MPPVNRLRPGLIGAVAVIALLLVGVIMGQVAAARVGVIQCTRASLAAAVALWPAAVRLTTSIAACCCCSFWVLLGQGEEHWVVFVDGVGAADAIGRHCLGAGEFLSRTNTSRPADTLARLAHVACCLCDVFQTVHPSTLDRLAGVAAAGARGIICRDVEGLTGLSCRCGAWQAIKSSPWFD